jgi:CPA1 family monovalent cation:H+ antiporter
MFFIASGAVEVDRDGRQHRLGRGDFFGELALLTGRRRTADVTAIAYCRLLELPGREFRRFLKSHPDVRAEIRRVADDRLRDRTGEAIEAT